MADDRQSLAATVSRIRCAVRARARRDADRALAAALRLALHLREGGGGAEPPCPAELREVAQAFAEAYPDELRERWEGLTREGLTVAAAGCRRLFDLAVAEGGVVH